MSKHYFKHPKGIFYAVVDLKDNCYTKVTLSREEAEIQHVQGEYATQLRYGRYSVEYLQTTKYHFKKAFDEAILKIQQIKL